MKIGPFEFNLRELAGSMGDFGTLFPLAIGFIAINGLHPAGLFIMLGLSNIALGLVYRLPMPLQPKKVIAVAAIAQRWSPMMIYASGFWLGITWFVLVFTGALRKIIALTPMFIVRGIQLALGILLAWEGFKLMRPNFLLGIVAIIIVVILRDNRYAPAALVLMGLGVAIVCWNGDIRRAFEISFTLPPLTLPRLHDVSSTMILAGLAQIPLSITNAVIATAALIRDYFPDKAVSERKLMINMGVMNMVSACFGGMPMCHGAGGLAGQYYFGARTGGANILEGLMEISLGLFLSQSIANLMAAFPMPLVGGMMTLVGYELSKPIRRLHGWKSWLAVATAIVSVAANMAIGFGAGLAGAYLVRGLQRRRIVSCRCVKPQSS
jgi:hypothetical protein